MLQPLSKIARGLTMATILILLSSPCWGQPMQSPWPMFMHDIHHTGLSPNSGPDSANLLWSFHAEGAVQSSPMIGDDGTIYVGCGSMSGGTKFYAINPDGTEKWSFEGGDAFWSSPAIDEDGTVYIGCWDHNLYAFNPDGSLKWTYTTGDKVYPKPMIGPDGTVYVGSNDNKFYAINPDGTLKWNYETGGWIWESAAAIDDNGNIYVGSFDDSLYCFDPDGMVLWTFYLGGNTSSSPTIGSDGTIYIGSYDDNLYAINPDGTLKWTCGTGGNVNSTAGIGADGTIYTGSTSDNVYAIDPDDGSIIWTFLTGSNVNTSMPIDAEGTIYAGSSDDYLYAINPDGTMKWSFATGHNVVSTPAIGLNKTIYFGSQDEYLYAIGTPLVEEVSIEMVPDNPPVTVPAGATFLYEGILTNNTDDSIQLDVWTKVGLPGGGYYGPLKVWEDYMLPGGETVSFYPIRQWVMRSAPAGDYEYIAYCGDYDANIIDSTYFTVTVTAPAEGGSETWAVYGWFDEEIEDIPADFALIGNFPNPFNAVTTISFDLSTSGNVNLEVYNLMGQKVETLADGLMEAGHHSVQWDASAYSSGIYFYRLTAGEKVFTKRMTLMK